VKKTFLVLLISAFPVLATACGDGTVENNTDGDDVTGVSETDTEHAAKPHGHDADGDGKGQDHHAGGDSKGQDHHADGDSMGQDHHAGGDDKGQDHHAGGDDKGQDHHAGGDSKGQDHHESATGQPGDPENVSRTIEVAMSDTMRFTPDQFTVSAGETIQFAVRNDGQIPHEFVIGSMSEMMEHAKMMRTMPTMKHAEANILTLGSGETGNITWQFDKAGTVDFACLIPGHFEAGMKGSVTVE
jgi:uncharacterized cupredoxin-like copper-binding protein